MNDKNEILKERAARLFCFGFYAFLLFLGFKYALGAFLPFVLAYAVALVIKPISKRSAERTKIPEKLFAAAYVTLAIGLIGAVVVFCVSRILREAEALISSENGSSFSLARLFGGFELFFDRLLERVGLEGEYGIAQLLCGLEERLIDTVGGYVTGALAGIVSKMPSIIISSMVALVSCYYFALDKEGIVAQIKKVLPEKYMGSILRAVSLGAVAIKKYAKAYLVLMIITFFELAIGLSVLRVSYSFLIALLISVVDILPVLGAGTVLLPWALIAFLIQNSSLGVGLIVLYGIITIIRQIAEPHIVGTTIGLHPLVSLFFMYAGFRLFGFFGMISGPALAFIAFEMAKRE